MATGEKRIRSWSHGELSHQEGRVKLPKSWGGRLIVREEKNKEVKEGSLVLRHKGHTIERPLNFGLYAHWRLRDLRWSYRTYGSGTGVMT